MRHHLSSVYIVVVIVVRREKDEEIRDRGHTQYSDPHVNAIGRVVVVHKTRRRYSLTARHSLALPRSYYTWLDSWQAMQWRLGHGRSISHPPCCSSF